MGNIELEPMKLIFTLDNNFLKREVVDLDGNVIWESGNEPYCEIYGSVIIDEYETQMMSTPYYNIIEVIKNI